MKTNYLKTRGTRHRRALASLTRALAGVIHQKLVYLHDNPVIEGVVDKAEEYLYSSARDYYQDKNGGLIEIKFIT